VNQDRNETDQEFMEEIVEDLGYTPKGERNPGSGSGIGQGPFPTYLILGGVGMVLLIAVAIFLLMGRGAGRPEEFAALKSRISRLEERMAVLTRIEERIAVMARIEERMARLEGMKALKGLAGIEERIDRIEKEARDLHQQIQKTASHTPPPEAKQPATQAAKKPVQEVKQRYHTVRAGETLFTIARKYGLSLSRLCQINKISPKASIRPGQKLLVGS